LKAKELREVISSEIVYANANVELRKTPFRVEYPIDITQELCFPNSTRFEATIYESGTWPFPAVLVCKVNDSKRLTISEDCCHDYYAGPYTALVVRIKVQSNVYLKAEYSIYKHCTAQEAAIKIMEDLPKIEVLLGCKIFSNGESLLDLIR